jgi:hypothetical protein
MKRFIFIFVCLATISTTFSEVNAQHIPESVSMRIDKGPKRNSPFWLSFQINYRGYIQNPCCSWRHKNYSISNIKIEKNTYFVIYLRTKHILPDKDALTIVSDLNPGLGDSVQAGTRLNLPAFSEEPVKKNKEFDDNFKKFNTYSKEEHMNLTKQIDQFNENYMLLELGKIKTYSDSFWVYLNFLSTFYKTKLASYDSRGETNLLTQHLITINKILGRINKDKTGTKTDERILLYFFNQVNAVYKSTGESTSNSNIRQFISNKDRITGVADMGSNDENFFAEPKVPAGYSLTDYYINKKVEIYAVEVLHGKPSKLFGEFSYAFMGAGEAFMDKEMNGSKGFTDKDETVSVALQEMVVSDYVFRFTNIKTKKVYWRCYKSDDFKLYENEGTKIGKNTLRLIFNYQVEDCHNFL